MRKATVNMRNWQLNIYNEEYILSGIADRHPTIGLNAHISRTSSLVDYSFDNETLIYETLNTIYICPLKYMSPYPYRNKTIEYKLKLAQKTELSILDRIVVASAKIALEYEKDHLEEQWPKDSELNLKEINFSGDAFFDNLKDLLIIGQKEIEEKENIEDSNLIQMAQNYSDCIYLEITSVSMGNKLAFNLQGNTGIIRPSLHSGMFQDSILYLANIPSEDNMPIDFRYFPKGFDDVMETYCWSPNIKQVVLKNKCMYTIFFNKQEIMAEETKIFVRPTDAMGPYA